MSARPPPPKMIATEAAKRQLKTIVGLTGRPSFVAPSGPDQCVPSGPSVAPSGPILAASVGDDALSGNNNAATVGDDALSGHNFIATVGPVIAPPGIVAAPKRPAISGPKYTDKKQNCAFLWSF